MKIMGTADFEFGKRMQMLYFKYILSKRKYYKKVVERFNRSAYYNMSFIVYEYSIHDILELLQLGVKHQSIWRVVYKSHGLSFYKSLNEKDKRDLSMAFYIVTMDEKYPGNIGMFIDAYIMFVNENSKYEDMQSYVQDVVDKMGDSYYVMFKYITHQLVHKLAIDNIYKVHIEKHINEITDMFMERRNVHKLKDFADILNNADIKIPEAMQKRLLQRHEAVIALYNNSEKFDLEKKNLIRKRYAEYVLDMLQ